jgi:4'-phosphopantetheinyl transferase
MKETETRQLRHGDTPAGIEIWLTTLADEGQEAAGTNGLPLSADEWERARRFRSPPRGRQFVAGRRLLRAVLGRLLDVAPEAVALELAPTGRPVLKGDPKAEQDRGSADVLPASELNQETNRVTGGRDARGPIATPLPAFSLAHAGDVVLLAVARDGRAVGADVEFVAAETDWRSVAEKFLAEAEREALLALPEAERGVGFFTLWARKEALAKAWEHGAAAPMDRYAVAADPAQPAALLACDFDAEAPERWAIADLALAVEGYVGALAYARGAEAQPEG